jgi:glycerol-3-phosphate O-acyltransferase/dihydroxyacetone phosphate acyltransferase
MPSPLGAIAWLARAVTWVFYRVDQAGTAPPDGAVLLLPNHPNALLDPAVVWATAGRHVRFLAKSPLFHGPLRPLLAGTGAIPVYRRIDEGADTSKNAETFEEVHAALARGDAVCLFPEGVSHSTGHLEPLRTGAARMALAAERSGTRVALVPVGLNFDRKAAFRSRVTVAYGRPFSCREIAETSSEGDPAAVRALTDLMARQMRRLLIEADPHADARLVQRVDRLYSAARGSTATADERIARRRAIAVGMERLRSMDPQRYDEILLRVRRYDERLRRFRLGDRHLDWTTATPDAVRFTVRELLAGTVLLPLAAAGLALFFVPYHLTAAVARRVTREPDVAATAKVITGTVVYTVWLAALVALAWWIAGPAAAVGAALAVPAVAVASLFAIERESAVLDAVRAWLLLRRTSTETRERLRRRRSELADLLDEVYEWLSGGAAPDGGASGTPARGVARTPR